MRDKRIPTVLGLLILAIGVVAGVFLVQSRQLFSPAAAPEETPQQIRITNISDKSFTVSWVTESRTQGFVSYGRSADLGSVAQDQNPAAAFLHHIEVTGLSPTTTYFFKVGSGKNIFDNDGEPYRVTTATSLGSVPSSDIIFGSVQDANGESAQGAIVYLTASGISPLSATVDSSGNWTIPLSTALSLNLSSYATYDEATRLQIFVQAGEGQFASATVLVAGARPVPPIILGQTHDFTTLKPTDSGEVPTSKLELPEKQESQGSRFTFEEETRPASTKVEITSPNEQEEVNTTRPSFVGTGTPGTTFTITVESPVTLSDEVTVGASGNWTWAPPENLEPGEHTVTITYQDEGGIMRTLQRSFTVLAADTSDLPSFTASPSATATASPSGSPSPATGGASPSPSPTATPAARTSIPSTEGGVPTPGNLTATLGLFIMGIVLLLAGLFLPKVLKY